MARRLSNHAVVRLLDLSGDTLFFLEAFIVDIYRQTAEKMPKPIDTRCPSNSFPGIPALAHNNISSSPKETILNHILDKGCGDLRLSDDTIVRISNPSANALALIDVCSLEEEDWFHACITACQPASGTAVYVNEQLLDLMANGGVEVVDGVVNFIASHDGQRSQGLELGSHRANDAGPVGVIELDFYSEGRHGSEALSRNDCLKEARGRGHGARIVRFGLYNERVVLVDNVYGGIGQCI
ncbi:hypothetical protein PG995_007817 [Apiospora arundinis]